MTAHEPRTETELRLVLRERGYHPVPVSSPDMNVSSAGKRPTMSQWESRCAEHRLDQMQRAEAGPVAAEPVGIASMKRQLRMQARV